MPRPLVLRSFLGFLIASTAAAAGAEDTRGEFLKAALGREIIGPRQTLADTADYVEAHVPRMPEVKTLAEWEQAAGRMRADALEQVVFRGEAAAWRDAKSRVEWLETIEGGPGYRIKKLRYEALPGLWIPALLYEPETLAGKVPVVLNVNGHDAKGKAADYKQIRCINLAKRGMLALNPEWFGMGQLATDAYRHDLINQIDLCGTGGIATHYLAMTRGLDVLLALEHADPERVAVTGLSGGGWQTIFISALDTRVTLTNPVAGYSSFLTRVRHFSDLGDSEQTPCDLATVADYAPMTAMMAPRPTLLTYNAKDNCCFAAGHALPPLLEAARPIFKLYEKEANLRSHVNHDPGTHNYELDNRQAFYRMLGDHFFKGQEGYDPKEIPSDSEVKTREQLDVTLPADNATLHSLALGLSKGLPRSPAFPKEKAAAEAWRGERREKLREVVRAKRFEVQAVETAARRRRASRPPPGGSRWASGPSRSSSSPRGARRRRSCSSPTRAARRPRGRPRSCSTGGTASSSSTRSPSASRRSPRASTCSPSWSPRWATVPSACRRASSRRSPAGPGRSQGGAGDDRRRRPEGERHGARRRGARRDGDRRPRAARALGSLKEVIETNLAFPKAPELFCFGLLRDFDVLQLAALVAPRPVVFVKPSDRAKAELAGLKAWYATLGQPFEPLRYMPVAEEGVDPAGVQAPRRPPAGVVVGHAVVLGGVRRRMVVVERVEVVAVPPPGPLVEHPAALGRGAGRLGQGGRPGPREGPIPFPGHGSRRGLGVRPGDPQEAARRPPPSRSIRRSGRPSRSPGRG